MSKQKNRLNELSLLDFLNLNVQITDQELKDYVNRLEFIRTRASQISDGITLAYLHHDFEKVLCREEVAKQGKKPLVITDTNGLMEHFVYVVKEKDGIPENPVSKMAMVLEDIRYKIKRLNIVRKMKWIPNVLIQKLQKRKIEQLCSEVRLYLQAVKNIQNACKSMKPSDPSKSSAFNKNQELVIQYYTMVTVRFNECLFVLNSWNAKDSKSNSLAEMSLFEFVDEVKCGNVNSDIIGAIVVNQSSEMKSLIHNQDFSKAEYMLNLNEKVAYFLWNQFKESSDKMDHDVIRIMDFPLVYYCGAFEKEDKQPKLSKGMEKDIQYLEKLETDSNDQGGIDIVGGLILLVIGIVCIFLAFKFSSIFTLLVDSLGLLLGVAGLILLFTAGIVAALIIPGVFLLVCALLNAIVPLETLLLWIVVLICGAVALFGAYYVFYGLKQKSKSKAQRDLDKEVLTEKVALYTDFLEKMIYICKYRETPDEQRIYNENPEFLKVVQYSRKKMLDYYQDVLRRVRKIGKPKLNRI